MTKRWDECGCGVKDRLGHYQMDDETKGRVETTLERAHHRDIIVVTTTDSREWEILLNLFEFMKFVPGKHPPREEPFRTDDGMIVWARSGAFWLPERDRGKHDAFHLSEEEDEDDKSEPADLSYG